MYCSDRAGRDCESERSGYEVIYDRTVLYETNQAPKQTTLDLYALLGSSAGKRLGSLGQGIVFVD
jgi:hypothetical protein